MKKVLKINYLTYFFAISAILCGMFKDCLILFSIILVHELGHVITILYFKYKIDNIEIFPFGGITHINKDINSPINHELLISISGIIAQLILFIIVTMLHNQTLIDYNFYYLFKKYNFSIIIFNLLPIIPLDGSIFIKSLLEKVFSFKTSNYLNVFISIIVLIIFFYINYLFSFNNYLICFFLLYKIIIYIKEYKYLENRFLLERYINNYNFKKIKKIKTINDISKEKISYAYEANKIVKEKEILRRYFKY